jgi:hypothetical protein
MSEKMPERTKTLLINASIVAALIWCYFRGYTLTVILVAGLLLLGVANFSIYLKRRRIKNRPLQPEQGESK